MPILHEFDTGSVRGWKNPPPVTKTTLTFPRAFVAPPRLPHGFRELDIDRNANIRVKTMFQNVTTTSAEWDITTYSDSTLYSAIDQVFALAPGELEFLTGEHTRNLITNPDHPVSVRINFDRPFVTPPKVVVFFNHFDVDKSQNLRLYTSASAIDAYGFTLDIQTWGDTILYAAQACWIAYPEDREHIFSTSVNTNDVRPWNEPQLTQTRNIDFNGVSFWKNPSVFIALNKLDISCNANLRVKAYVNGVSMTGLDWHIDTWGDSTLYSAGASIIAFN